MFKLHESARKDRRIAERLRCLALVLTVNACLAIGMPPSALAQEVGTYAHVTAGALNLREAPNTGSAVIRSLTRETVVSILERKGSWAKVFVQGSGGTSGEGWVAARYLGWDGDRTRASRDYHRPAPGRGYGHRHRRHAAPLRVSKLDFDCRRALFGNSGIRKCVASVRVQLPEQEYNPNRSDSVPVACRGVIAFQTEKNRSTQRMVSVERHSIAHNDRLGQSVRVDFDTRSYPEKIMFARLRSFGCARD